MRFKSSIEKLLKAWELNGIDPMDCAACAVGRLCGSSTGWAALRDIDTFTAYDEYYFPKPGMDARLKLAEESASASGYTLPELYQIEKAFLFGVAWQNEAEEIGGEAICIIASRNYNSSGDFWKQSIHNGLMRAIDKLAEIDRISESEREEAKNRFTLQLLEPKQDLI